MAQRLSDRAAARRIRDDLGRCSSGDRQLVCMCELGRNPYAVDDHRGDTRHLRRTPWPRSGSVSTMPTWLGFVWTSPNTLIGLVLGLGTFQRPRLAHGAIIFDRAPRGLTALMLRANRVAMTVGFVILSAHPLTGRLLAHEQHHIRQYEVWGPLFIPVYL